MRKRFQDQLKERNFNATKQGEKNVFIRKPTTKMASHS
jgi:hypothetical protein